MDDFEWNHRQTLADYLDERPDERAVYHRLLSASSWGLGCNDGIRENGERQRAWYFRRRSPDEPVDTVRATYREDSDAIRVYARDDEVFADAMDWFETYV